MNHTARKFSFSYTIPRPASEVWNLLYVRYTQVSDYANEIVASRPVPGTPTSGEGCQRLCEFDLTGTKYLLEELTQIDENSMRLTNKIVAVGKLPIVPEISKTTFTVHAMSPHTCRVDVDFWVRTKPAFLSLLMKGAARAQMNDLFVGAEHFLRTSQLVTKDNFKAIRKAAG